MTHAKRGITGNINVLAPADARGLEFDAVVVVEPEAVVEEDFRGERMLYVALTRTTRHLAVVLSARAMPLPPTGLSTPTQPADSDREPTPPEEAGSFSPLTSRQIRSVKALASGLADEIRESLEPHMWQAVVDELAEQLSDTEDRN